MRTINIALPDADLNDDGKVTFDELIRSTLYIAAMIAFFLLALLGGIGLILLRGPLIPTLVGYCLVLATVLGAVIGIRRQIRYERAERLEREELYRRWAREDYEFDVLRGAAQTETDTRWNSARQDQYARLWLNLSYERGKPITRDEWQRQGQPVEAWNRTNSLMKRRGIRRGSSLAPDTLAEAWGAWCEAELESRAWVQSAKGEYVKD